MFNLTTTDAGLNRWIQGMDLGAQRALQNGQLNSFEKSVLELKWNDFKTQYQDLSKDGLTREEKVTLFNSLNALNRTLSVSRNQDVKDLPQLDREISRIFGDHAAEAPAGHVRRQDSLLAQIERGRQEGKISGTEADILTRMNREYNTLHETLSSGGLTKEEKLQLTQKMSDMQQAIQTARAFDITDANKDGAVNEADLRLKMKDLFSAKRPEGMDGNATGMAAKLNAIDIRIAQAGDKINEDEKKELDRMRNAFSDEYNKLLTNDDDGDGKADNRLTEAERISLRERLDQMQARVGTFIRGDWHPNQDDDGRSPR